LLYNNDFTIANAESWERDVFIRSIKSFNKAMGQDYHTELTQYPDLDYDQDLIDTLKGVLKKYED